MSYKAFASLKSRVELETIARMTPDAVNTLLNKQAERIKVLERALGLAKEMIISNGLDIPKTITVITDALPAPRERSVESDLHPNCASDLPPPDCDCCNDTGDIHRPDGKYLGRCNCSAGTGAAN